MNWMWMKVSHLTTYDSSACCWNPRNGESHATAITQSPIPSVNLRLDSSQCSNQLSQTQNFMNQSFNIYHLFGLWLPKYRDDEVQAYAVGSEQTSPQLNPNYIKYCWKSFTYIEKCIWNMKYSNRSVDNDLMWSSSCNRSSKPRLLSKSPHIKYLNDTTPQSPQETLWNEDNTASRFTKR